MECKDVLRLVASYGQMALQGGALWATIYFYKQLVENDNRREQRAAADQRRRDNDVIKKWTKDIFRNAGNAGGQPQASDCAPNFPMQFRLFLRLTKNFRSRNRAFACLRPKGFSNQWTGLSVDTGRLGMSGPGSLLPPASTIFK